jgi:hypothetical protein
MSKIDLNIKIEISENKVKSNNNNNKIRRLYEMWYEEFHHNSAFNSRIWKILI